MKNYDGFSQKSQHIVRKTKLTIKKKENLSEKNSWTLKDECRPETDYSVSQRGRKRKAAHDTTFEYFHHSRIVDDISTSHPCRKGKAAYGGETGVETSTESAATSAMSTPTVELCYDSYWTDRYFII